MEWNTVATVIAAIGSMITACTAIITAWVAYKKFLKEETISAQEDRIEVFKTSKQTTEIRATNRGLELYLFDIRPGRGGRQWILSPNKVRNVIEGNHFTVSSQSSTSQDFGRFSIGDNRRWLYSKSLYPQPKDLHDDLRRLMDRVIKIQGTES